MNFFQNKVIYFFSSNIIFKKIFFYAIILIMLSVPAQSAKKILSENEFLIAEGTNYIYPDVYGPIVAWAESWQGNPGVFFKNLNSGFLTKIAGEDDEGFPSVYENLIVWTNDDLTPGLFLHDTLEGTTDILLTTFLDNNPTNAKIFADTIIWHGNHGGGPIILSGYNRTSGNLFEISNGNDLYGIDIYQQNVVWGSSDSIWIKNLSSGQVQGPLDTSYPEMGGSLWPYNTHIYKDLVIWKSQLIDNSGELKTWGIFGRYLTNTEVFPIHSNAQYHSEPIDIYENIILWVKSEPGFQVQSLWGLDLSNMQTFKVSENSFSGSIHKNLIVYSRDGSIYGNYVVTEGDINGDDTVDLTDLILTLKIISKTESDAEISFQGEINRDNVLGIEEALFIMQFISKVRD
jgi:hypothetical protein